jgi:hypothetical protein
MHCYAMLILYHHLTYTPVAEGIHGHKLPRHEIFPFSNSALGRTAPPRRGSPHIPPSLVRVLSPSPVSSPSISPSSPSPLHGTPAPYFSHVVVAISLASVVVLFLSCPARSTSKWDFPPPVAGSAWGSWIFFGGVGPVEPRKVLISNRGAQHGLPRHVWTSVRLCLRCLSQSRISGV